MRERPENENEELTIRPGSGPLSPEEVEQALELIRDGMSCSELARISGRAKSYVSNLARRHGVEFNRAAQTAPARIARASDLQISRQALEGERLILAVTLLDPIRRLIEDLSRVTVTRRVNSRTGEMTSYKSLPGAADKHHIAVAIDRLFVHLNVALKDTEFEGQTRNAIMDLMARMRSDSANEDKPASEIVIDQGFNL